MKKSERKARVNFSKSLAVCSLARPFRIILLLMFEGNLKFKSSENADENRHNKSGSC